MEVGNYPTIQNINYQKMGLTVNQIQELLKAPKNQRAINAAKAYQQRIKFHVNTRQSRETAAAEATFLAWVQSLIPQDKYELFRALFQHPVKTTEVAGIIFDRLFKVWDGRNAVTNIQYLTTEESDDSEYYYQEILDWDTIWKTKGWDFFKTEINSIIVTDLPTAQNDKRPAPYFYWVRIADVIDYETDQSRTSKQGALSWVMFKTDSGDLAVYDDESYRIFARQTNGDLGEEKVNNAHDLGYCPATFFCSQPLDLNDEGVKWHPLADILSDLDWYLFFSISKRFLDLYGAYPIYSGYEQSCEYSNEEGDECQGGFIKNRQNGYKVDMYGKPVRCPICKNKRLRGPGSYVEVPIPIDGEQPDLRNPIQMLSADVASLQYNTKEEQRIRELLILTSTGDDGKGLTKEAVNETQVDASFESQTAVLLRVKTILECSMNFVAETVSKLRYGERFVSANINLGTDFYILTEEDLREQFAEAKKNGASEAELDALHCQILETTYRNDPIQMQRMVILSDLEPYRHFTREEVLELHRENLIDETDLQIKLNFATFVRRFERENMNIIEFGSLLPYNDKIEIITNKFKDYVAAKGFKPQTTQT